MPRTTALITTVLALATASALAHDPAMPATAATHSAEPMQGSSMPMTGDADADVDFATMMREHHQMALPMSHKELKDGKDPAMRRMAQHIIDAQTREIAQFDRWLAAHKKAATK